jgi:hypothetical protein
MTSREFEDQEEAELTRISDLTKAIDIVSVYLKEVISANNAKAQAIRAQTEQLLAERDLAVSRKRLESGETKKVNEKVHE